MSIPPIHALSHVKKDVWIYKKYEKCEKGS